MNRRWLVIGLTAVLVASVLYVLTDVVAPPVALAHCDTLDGPVVTGAKRALASGDVTPVLRWVQPKDEEVIRAAFARTLAVRSKGREAQELADMYFFETLVRIHRAGEGASYDGLKPAGTVEPGISEADAAIERQNVDQLARSLAEAVAEGVRHRFARVMELKAHADENVEAGRRYVEAYVDLIHYVERLHTDVAAQAGHQEHEMRHDE